jgi:putative transposase
MQGRYFSSSFDDAYLWAAIRYVERNRVRAKMVCTAERYPWSSAAVHCGLRDEGVLTQKLKWRKQFEQFSD